MLFRALLLSLTFVVSASAQQSKQIGRLSDGRAFRIDESGMRLIDQVAEMEVANDELKRQLVSTEDELRQKNGIIESLRAGIKVAPEDRLREQDLLGKTSSGLPKAATVVSTDNGLKQDCPVVKQECPVLKQDCPVTKQDCSNEMASLRSGFEQENDRCKDRIALLEAEKKQILAQSKTPDSERVQLITRLSKAEQEKSQLLEENESLKSNLEEKDRVIASTRSAGQEAENLRIAEEKEQNNKLKQELALLKEQLMDAQKESAKVQESRSSMTQVAAVIPTEQPVIRAAPSAEAKNLLQSIQSKIMKRKSFLDNVSKSGKGISLSASNLVTTNGLSLDRLRQVVTVNEAEGLKGLRQIEQILDTDIATASRLSR